MPKRKAETTQERFYFDDVISKLEALQSDPENTEFFFNLFNRINDRKNRTNILEWRRDTPEINAQALFSKPSIFNVAIEMLSKDNPRSLIFILQSLVIIDQEDEIQKTHLSLALNSIDPNNLDRTPAMLLVKEPLLIEHFIRLLDTKMIDLTRTDSLGNSVLHIASESTNEKAAERKIFLIIEKQFQKNLQAEKEDPQNFSYPASRTFAWMDKKNAEGLTAIDCAFAKGMNGMAVALCRKAIVMCRDAGREILESKERNENIGQEIAYLRERMKWLQGRIKDDELRQYREETRTEPENKGPNPKPNPINRRDRRDSKGYLEPLSKEERDAWRARQPAGFGSFKFPPDSRHRDKHIPTKTSCQNPRQFIDLTTGAENPNQR